MLPVIFIVPIVQLVVLVYAATLEMKKIDMVVVDQDLSSTSRKLISKFDGSPFFQVNGSTFSIREAENEITTDRADIVIVIPPDFEKELFKENKSTLQLQINAINATVAGLTNAYASMVIADFNRNIITENINYIQPSINKSISINTSYWYNPELNYKIYMLPGILVILVTIIGMFLAALNIVREKEMGTIEQINVTPIVKYQFIFGKLFPFWVIATLRAGLWVDHRKNPFQHPDGWKFVGALCIHCRLSHCCTWTRIVRFHTLQHPAAGHVPYVFFHAHVCFAQRNLHPCRKHA